MVHTTTIHTYKNPWGNVKMSSQHQSHIVSPLGHPFQNSHWNECCAHIVPAGIQKRGAKHTTAVVLCNLMNGWLCLYGAEEIKPALKLKLKMEFVC